ncbi:MAG: hypothetical protein HWE25_02555 [Alphaproteobacteria bacterium]|nr:hypothetical protein [Alphaproteobacteria bacterium]
MTAAQTPSPLLADTRLYPFQVNWLANQIYLLETQPAFYMNAAFLDQRAIQQGMQGNWASLNEVRAQTLGAPIDQPFGLIFHIGHCGSTLLSRALGLLDGFFSLREPLPLRDMATFWVDRADAWAQKDETALMEDIRMLRALWARAPEGRTSVVKATSFCSLLAKPWLSSFPNDMAMFLSMAPETYIATVLGAEGYVTDLVGGAKPRMRSLIEATGADLPALTKLSAGEIAALTYVAEMVNMERAGAQSPERVLRLDFDRYLNAPAESLKDMAAHFGKPVADDAIGAALANPVLGRYSKATDYAFSAGERLERLRASRAANKAEITNGMNWLVDFARTHTVFADALKAFGYAN